MKFVQRRSGSVHLRLSCVLPIAAVVFDRKLLIPWIGLFGWMTSRRVRVTRPCPAARRSSGHPREVVASAGICISRRGKCACGFGRRTCAFAEESVVMNRVVRSAKDKDILNRPDKRLRYAMISTEMRRDLDSPLALFEHLDILHFYRKTPWNDMLPEDFGPRLIHYSGPLDLIRRIRQCDPDVIQCLEPFALINLPYLMALTQYLRSSNIPLITVTLENIPLDRKYTRLGSLLMAPWIRSILRRSLLTFYLNDGGKENLARLGADENRSRFAMYGCWGTDTNELAPNGDRVQLAKEPNEIVLLFVGRLSDEKGIFDILHALSGIRTKLEQPVRLVIIGDGDGRSKAVETVRKLRLVPTS